MSKLPPTDSVFTPFFRRFTDERARDLDALRALYREVNAMHLACRFANQNSYIQETKGIYADFIDRIPEPLATDFCGALAALTRMEKTIFEFPEIKWDVEQLSLKEQVELERFLTSKRHFLTHQDKVTDLLREGLKAMFDTIFHELPEL